MISSSRTTLLARRSIGAGRRRSNPSFSSVACCHATNSRARVESLSHARDGFGKRAPSSPGHISPLSTRSECSASRRRPTRLSPPMSKAFQRQPRIAFGSKTLKSLRLVSIVRIGSIGFERCQRRLRRLTPACFGVARLHARCRQTLGEPSEICLSAPQRRSRRSASIEKNYNLGRWRRQERDRSTAH